MCGERGCIPCPSGLYCPEGLGPPEQQGGFWADPNVSQCDFSVLRCRDQFECPPGMLGRCSVGREGLACNNCQASHYPQGSVCEQCREGDTLPVILLILFLLCVLFFISVSRWDPSQVSVQVAQSWSQMELTTCCNGPNEVSKRSQHVLTCYLLFVYIVPPTSVEPVSFKPNYK